MAWNARDPHAVGVLVVLEHEHHGGFGVVRVGVGRGGDDGPVEVSRESVLLHLVAWAELREAEADAAADGLALVEDCVGADEEHLVAAGRHQEVTHAPKRYTSARPPRFVREDALREASSPSSKATLPGMANAEVASCTMRSFSADARGHEGGVATRCGRGRAKATRRRREARADSRGSAEGGGHDDPCREGESELNAARPDGSRGATGIAFSGQGRNWIYLPDGQS